MDEYPQPRTTEPGESRLPAANSDAVPEPMIGMRHLFWILCFLVALLALPSVVRNIQYAYTAGKERARVDVATEGLKNLNLTSLTTASRLVADKVGPSVVHIVTQDAKSNRAADEHSFFFGANPEHDMRGEGSGVIVDKDGYIVTNDHVIRGAQKIRIQLSGERTVAAEVVGADPLTDIAVLKVDAEDLVAAPWGDSEELRAGDLVWAVGSPFGLDRSVTFGIVSAKGRPGAASSFQGFLQTDAAVNPGNSGGPLINSQGQIVGINTAIVGTSYRGISFAIPSALAKNVYDKIRETGAVARGWLGVSMLELDGERAQALGLSGGKGILIEMVFEDSPAAKAGIQPRDIVLEWNDKPTPDCMALSRLVAATEVGSTATVKVLRERRELVLEVQVGQRTIQ